MKAEKVIPIPPCLQPPYCWLFIRDEQLIGVHKNNGWCTQLRFKELITFDAEEKFVLMMILLELNPSEFAQHLSEACQSQPEYAHSIRKFPSTQLLKHVFHSSISDYWPQLALNWLNHQPHLLPLFYDELGHMAADKAMSQNLRHRARRMLRSSAPAIPNDERRIDTACER
jgi:hypothetical protein